MTIYHVTPSRNVISIVAKGVDPAMSRGKLKVSWVCEQQQLMWAIAHISAHWRVATANLTVFELEADGELIRTRWRGVYQSRTRLWALTHESAEHYIESYEMSLLAPSSDDLPF